MVSYCHFSASCYRPPFRDNENGGHFNENTRYFTMTGKKLDGATDTIAVDTQRGSICWTAEPITRASSSRLLKSCHAWGLTRKRSMPFLTVARYWRFGSTMFTTHIRNTVRIMPSSVKRCPTHNLRSSFSTRTSFWRAML